MSFLPSSNPAFYLVHVNLISYALLWWVNQPCLPYLSSQLGASPVQIGYISSASHIFQLVGSPLMGRLMDQRGAKVALLFSSFFAALSYLLLACSTSIPLLYLSQIPTFFLCTMHASQAYLTLLSSAERRAEALGSLSLSYGIGMVLGPFIGGAASNYVSYEAIAAATSVASLAVMLVVAVALPDAKSASGDSTTEPLKAAGKSAEGASKAGGTLDALSGMLADPLLRSLVVIKLLAVLAISIYRSAFTLLAKDSYGLTAQQNGWIMSTVGMLSIFTNTFVVAALNRRYPPATVISTSLLLLALGFLPLPFSLTLPSLLFTLAPITITAATAGVLLTSTLTTSSPSAQAGQVLGVDQSVGTLSRVAGPVAAGWLLEGDAAQQKVGAICAALVAVAYAVSRLTPWGAQEKRTNLDGGDNKMRVE